MISLCAKPSSISGTNAGVAISNTEISSLISRILRPYMPLFIVTFVPITPTLFSEEQLWATFLAAGSIIPTIGISGNLSCRSAAQIELTVLQAMTIILTPLPTRKSEICVEKFLTVLSAFDPYGVRAVSPKYISFSSGSSSSMQLTHVSPPRPESNTPIGLLSIYVPFQFRPDPFQVFIICRHFFKKKTRLYPNKLYN